MTNYDVYDDPPTICPTTGAYCVRAFCDDYGCANQAGIPVDDYDVEAGSIHPDELMTPLPKVRKD